MSPFRVLPSWPILGVVIATATACSSSASSPAASSDASHHADVAALPGDPPRTGKVVEISSRDPVPVVHPGDLLEWRIADSSHSIAPEYRTEWSAPSVSGEAIRLLVSRHRASQQPGDSDVKLHVFLAMAPGKATVRSQGSSGAPLDLDAKEDLATPDLVIEVEVTAP